MPRIYISYRPEDSSRNEVRVIRERLIAEFGADNILEATGSNMEITTNLQRMVQSCDVLLVVVGQYWLNLMDEKGNNLLEDPYDPIHVEIDAGLKTLMGVYTLVVRGAPMPNTDSLPEALHPLVHKTMLEVPNDEQLHQVLDNWCKTWRNIPTGTMAEENGITLDTLDNVDVNQATRVDYQYEQSQRRIEQLHLSNIRWSKSNVSFWVALIGFVMLTSIALVAKYLVEDTQLLALEQTSDNAIRLEPVVSYDVFASTIGFIQPNDYFYYAEWTRGVRNTYAVNPQNPEQIAKLDIQPESFIQSHALISNGKRSGIGVEVGNRNIVFGQVDKDDHTIVAVSGMLDVYVVTADLLEPKFEYDAVHHKGQIRDNIFYYNPSTNLLVIHYGDDEIRFIGVGENAVYEDYTHTLSDIGRAIDQIAVSRDGRYLAVRTYRQVNLYEIIYNLS